MFIKPEPGGNPARLYEEAVQEFHRKDYVAAAEKFKYLSRLEQIEDADKYYSLSIAGMDCHDGFFGRALAIYDDLDLFCDAHRLAAALRSYLAPHNGFFKSGDEFLTNYLFIKDGKAALESGYLFGGRPEYAYDLQYKDDRIYCRYFPLHENSKQDCLLHFNTALNAVKLIVPKGAPATRQGVYFRADYAYEMQQR